MDSPTFGSLFAGIGGLDLGLERAGWTCRWQVENDPYCQRVLAKHWPDVARYGDVKECDPDDLEPVDLIAGGFPCQPVSNAGGRRGQGDERWLWPEFARIIRGVRPRLVLVENVPGLLTRGMGDVLGQLAEGGYDARWDCIPAAAVGAPHLRWRLFIVAAQGRVPDAFGDQLRVERQRLGQQRDESWASLFGDDGAPGAVADTSSAGHEPISRGLSRDAIRPDGPVIGDQSGGRSPDVADADGIGGEPWTRQRREGGRAEPDWWEVEPDVGRVAHGVPYRVDRLRALGNAVVPQVAEWVGRHLLTEIQAA